jgi:predicted DNA-binding transcriptional regulator AlpA
MIMKEDRLLKIDDCLKIIPVARSTWWQQVKSGTLPKPVKIGSSCQPIGMIIAPPDRCKKSID